MLDSDPAIRWQALQDLTDSPADALAAERARVATEGWGARLLALQGEDGQWAGGACFPRGWFESTGGKPDENGGQPWTSTLPTLHLLLELGIDPDGEQVRRAVAQVVEKCRWECDDLPFCGGEEEPCINGRTVALGVYFGHDVDGIVARLLGEQLEDGGWNCWAHAARLGLLPGGRGSAGPADGRSRGSARIEAAARRHLAAGEHPPR